VVGSNNPLLRGCAPRLAERSLDIPAPKFTNDPKQGTHNEAGGLNKNESKRSFPCRTGSLFRLHKAHIEVGQAVVDEEAWPSGTWPEFYRAKKSEMTKPSKWIG